MEPAVPLMKPAPFSSPPRFVAARLLAVGAAVLLAGGLVAPWPAVAAAPVATLRVQASPDTPAKSVDKLTRALDAGKLAACLAPGTFGRVAIRVDDGGVRVTGASSEAGACLEKAVGKAVSPGLGPMRAGVEVLRARDGAAAPPDEATRTNMATGIQSIRSLVAPALELEVKGDPATALVELSSPQAEGYLECLRPLLLRDERFGSTIVYHPQGDHFEADLDAEVRLDRCASPVMKTVAPAKIAPPDSTLTLVVRTLPMEGKVP